MTGINAPLLPDANGGVYDAARPRARTGWRLLVGGGAAAVVLTIGGVFGYNLYLHNKDRAAAAGQGASTVGLGNVPLSGAYRPKPPPPADCGTPTPSFQRLMALLPAMERLISRICMSE